MAANQFNVKTGYGYLKDKVTGEPATKCELGKGLKDIPSGFTYVEVASKEELDTLFTPSLEKVREEVLEIIRFERNGKLIFSDWTQLNDSPLTSTQITLWKSYRQELRDLTDVVSSDLEALTTVQSIGDYEAIWPAEPI